MILVIEVERPTVRHPNDLRVGCQCSAVKSAPNNNDYHLMMVIIIIIMVMMIIIITMTMMKLNISLCSLSSKINGQT